MLDERDQLHEHPGGSGRHLDGPQSALPLQHNPGRAAEDEGTRRPPGLLCSVEKHFAGV